MPIKIQSNLPARKILESESIFVMTEERAVTQDIRPLKIAIVNLMPIKSTTETQLLRHLSNTPLQVDISLIRMESHDSKNTLEEHLEKFYTPSSALFKNKYDGLIVTGAPIEKMDFEEIDYWNELCGVMDWAKENVFSTLYICWAAHAGLYHNYGVPKRILDKKMFGIFLNKRFRYENSSNAEVVSTEANTDPLLRGFDDVFPIPQSRYTTINYEDIAAHKDLIILADSKECGPSIIKDKTNIFMTGHLEYDANTLGEEYKRDKAKNLAIDVPKNYFPDDNPDNAPLSYWRSTASLFYRNWLNYYVYQETPFNFVN